MLREKIKNNIPGILLYGLTPPKENSEILKIKEVAKKQLERLENTSIDGLVIYDLQDESSRTDKERTFKFAHNIHPKIYHEKFLHSKYPAIIYQAIGKYDKENLQSFCEKNSLSVFVGASSKNDTLTMSLDEAYRVKKESKGNLIVGGICIPERHYQKGDEELRVASKVFKGCEFFVTQTIYSLENAKKFIDDFVDLGIKKVPIIFTFTPCGCIKTLEFMRWLGIFVPDYFEKRLFSHENTLQDSIKLSADMFEFLYNYAKAKGVSVGANIESISSRKVEVDASIELLHKIEKIIKDENRCNFREPFESASKVYE